MVCGCAIALEGQSNGPNNQTPAQANEARNPPSEQTQPISGYQVINTPPDQPEEKPEKGYGQQFVENLLTDPIVWLTIALTYLATVQLKVYRAEVRDTRAVERGYLSVAHTKAGWVRTLTDSHHVDIEIRNAGNTPVAVDRGVFRLVANIQDVTSIELAPTDQQAPGGFLVREKHYITGLNFKLTEPQFVALHTGKLYLIGWVDYADAFDEIHRAGYARHVLLLPDKSIALVWDTPSARFNYDQAIDRHGQPHQQQGQPQPNG